MQKESRGQECISQSAHGSGVCNTKYAGLSCAKRRKHRATECVTQRVPGSIMCNAQGSEECSTDSTGFGII